MIEPRLCPQCGSKSALAMPRYSTPEWHVVACDSCHFVFLRNCPPYESLVEDLALQKTSSTERIRRRAARPALIWLDYATRWRLHLFSRGRADLYRRLFRPGRVLDIGCGSGNSIPDPFLPYGIEISRVLFEAAAAAMSVRGGKAIHGPAAEAIAAFPDRFFSGVVMSSVLEHETRPKHLLAEVARVLRDDGSAFIRVPNFSSINRLIGGGQWCGIRHPDHVNYFTLASLRSMASDCGLALRLLHPLRLPVDDNINAVLRKPSIGA